MRTAGFSSLASRACHGTPKADASERRPTPAGEPPRETAQHGSAFLGGGGQVGGMMAGGKRGRSRGGGVNGEG